MRNISDFTTYKPMLACDKNTPGSIGSNKNIQRKMKFKQKPFADFILSRTQPQTEVTDK